MAYNLNRHKAYRISGSHNSGSSASAFKLMS